MNTFFVDLHGLLAGWAESLYPVIFFVLFLYILTPSIYLWIKFPSKGKLFEMDIEASEREIKLVDKYSGAFLLYGSILGLLLGFMIQAWFQSAYALLLLPGCSIVTMAGMIFVFERERERIKVIKKKRQARRNPPEITDPQELEEARLLQRLIEGYDQEHILGEE